MEQQAEMARHAGRTLAFLDSEQVNFLLPRCGAFIAVYCMSLLNEMVFLTFLFSTYKLAFNSPSPVIQYIIISLIP